MVAMVAITRATRCPPRICEVRPRANGPDPSTQCLRRLPPGLGGAILAAIPVRGGIADIDIRRSRDLDPDTLCPGG